MIRRFAKVQKKKEKKSQPTLPDFGIEPLLGCDLSTLLGFVRPDIRVKIRLERRLGNVCSTEEERPEYGFKPRQI